MYVNQRQLKRRKTQTNEYSSFNNYKPKKQYSSFNEIKLKKIKEHKESKQSMLPFQQIYIGDLISMYKIPSDSVNAKELLSIN